MVVFLVFCGSVGLVLAGYTWWRMRRIEASHVPDGTARVVDGFELHYHFFPAENAAPDEPVLVFIHGASGNAYDSMLAFKDAMLGRHPMLFVDRPGLGFSKRDLARHSTPEGQARLLSGLLKALGIPNAIVIGHSLGAAIAADLGLAAPDRVKGLAFIAPATHPWPGGVNWYYRVAAWPLIGPLFCHTLTLPVGEWLAPKAIDRVFHPDPAPPGYADDIRLPLLFLPSVFRSNSADIARLKKHVLRQADRYRELTQPALVVTGTRDTVVWPSIHSEGLFRDLPKAELMVLNGAGHMPHHTHTARIVEGLERLVGRARQAADPAPEPQADAKAALAGAG